MTSPRPPEEVARARLATVTGGADSTGGDATGGAAGIGSMMGGMGGIGSIFQMAMPLIQQAMNKGQSQPSGPDPSQAQAQAGPSQGAPDGSMSSPGSQMGAAPRRHRGAPNVSVNVSITR